MKNATNDNSGCLIPFGAVFAIIGFGIGLSALFQGPVRARDLGQRVIMAAIFGGAGAIVVVWGVSTRRTAQRFRILAAQNPDQPWLWREDWARGAVEPESKSEFLTYGLMGVLFLLVSVPALLNLKHELFDRHNYAILVALIFPLAGSFLIGHALLGRVRARSSFLGIARTRTVAATQIQRFQLYPAMRSGDRVWYDLRVFLTNGRMVTAGSGLEKREGEWLENEIKKNLELLGLTHFERVAGRLSITPERIHRSRCDSQSARMSLYRQVHRPRRQRGGGSGCMGRSIPVSRTCLRPLVSSSTRRPSGRLEPWPTSVSAPWVT